MTDQDRTERFLRMQAAGASASEIASAFGVTTRTVERWRSAAGVAKPPARAYGPEARNRARVLLEDGCSFREVARTLGVVECTVRRWFPEIPAWTKSQAGQMAAMARRLAS